MIAKEERQENREKNLYRPYLESVYKDDEIKSNDNDLMGLMGLMQKQHLNYDKINKFMTKKMSGTLSEQEQEELAKEDKIVREKMEEAAKSKTYINFFNNGSLKLMDSTPPSILTELGIRAHTGSRDVPKDEEKALKLLQYSLDRARNSDNEADVHMAEYY